MMGKQVAEGAVAKRSSDSLVHAREELISAGPTAADAAPRLVVHRSLAQEWSHTAVSSISIHCARRS